MDKLKSAAIILLGVGENNAGEILKSMTPKEVRAIIDAINDIDNVTEEDVVQALNDFFVDSNHSAGIDVAAKEQVKNSLISALGHNGIGLVIQGSNGERAKWLELLRMQPINNIASLIQDEHPQIVTAIVVMVFNNISSDMGTRLIKEFPKTLQSQIFRRMSTMGSISRFAIDVLSQFFTEELIDSKKNNIISVEGLETVANIISFLDSQTEREIMSDLIEKDKELGEQIQDKIFPFQRLANLDKKSLQILLGEVKNEDLVLALKGVDERVKDVFFQNMSAKSVDILKDDIESKGPVKLANVLDAQKGIIRLAKKLEQEEKIILTGKNNNDVVF